MQPVLAAFGQLWQTVCPGSVWPQQQPKGRACVCVWVWVVAVHILEGEVQYSLWFLFLESVAFISHSSTKWKWFVCQELQGHLDVSDTQLLLPKDRQRGQPRKTLCSPQTHPKYGNLTCLLTAKGCIDYGLCSTVGIWRNFHCSRYSSWVIYDIS